MKAEKDYFAHIRRDWIRTPGSAALTHLMIRASRAKAPTGLQIYVGDWRGMKENEPRRSEKDLSFEERMDVFAAGASSFMECIVFHWKRYCNSHDLPMDPGSFRRFASSCPYDLPVSDLILSQMFFCGSSFQQMAPDPFMERINTDKMLFPGFEVMKLEGVSLSSFGSHGSFAL